MIVEKLSHLIRHIPVTVLAVYPDQTCDVELGSNFIAAWENAPHKPYALQGQGGREVGGGFGGLDFGLELCGWRKAKMIN